MRGMERLAGLNLVRTPTRLLYTRGERRHLAMTAGQSAAAERRKATGNGRYTPKKAVHTEEGRPMTRLLVFLLLGLWVGIGLALILNTVGS